MKINSKSFNITHHKITSKNDKYYVLLDTQEFLDDKGFPRTKDVNKACAKAVYGRKSKHITDRKAYYTYHIQCSQNNEAYNPIDLHSTVQIKKTNAFIDKVCKEEVKFQEVDQSIFDQYIEFLKTKNARMLKDINRRLK